MIRARRFIIATGSKPVPFDIPGLADVTAFTAETIFENTRRPGHLVIVGGDALALELAQAHRRLGADVTVVAPEPLLAGTDPELRDVVLQPAARGGHRLPREREPVSVNARGAGVALADPRSRGRGAGDDQRLAPPPRSARASRRSTVSISTRPASAATRSDPDHLQLGRNLKTTNPRIHAIGEPPAPVGPRARCSRRSSSSATRSSATPRLPTRCSPRSLHRSRTRRSRARPSRGANEQLKDRFRVVRAAFAENDRARATRETYGLAKVDRRPQRPDPRRRGRRSLRRRTDQPLRPRHRQAPDRRRPRVLRRAAPDAAARSSTGSARPGEKDQKPGPWLERRLKLQRMLP